MEEVGVTLLSDGVSDGVVGAKSAGSHLHWDGTTVSAFAEVIGVDAVEARGRA